MEISPDRRTPLTVREFKRLIEKYDNHSRIYFIGDEKIPVTNCSELIFDEDYGVRPEVWLGTAEEKDG